MRLSILSLGLVAGLFATTASAQFMDLGGTEENQQTQAILLGDASLSTTVEPFDIDAAITALAEEFCDVDENDNSALDSCPSTPAFDVRQALADAQAWTLTNLLAARANSIIAEARTEVLRRQLIEEEVRAALQAKQAETGFMYSADDVADLAAEADGYWQRIIELEEELGLLQDEAAENCRRNRENDVELDVCAEPAHQRALERL